MSALKVIKCRACHPKEPMGCGTCGGYKIVYQAVNCPTCKNWSWHRPGHYTVYEGKQFRTLEGVLIQYSLKGKSICSLCPPKVRERISP